MHFVKPRRGELSVAQGVSPGLHKIQRIDIDGKNDAGRAKTARDVVAHVFDEQGREFSVEKFHQHMIAITSPDFCNTCRCRAKNAAFFWRQLIFQNLLAVECCNFSLFFISGGAFKFYKPG